MTDINVLILVGLRAASINRELAKVAVDSSALATRRIRCHRPDCSSGDGSLVKFGFGGGLCAPEQGDGNLIHHRRDREHTNRPRPHHDLCSVWAARQKPFIALQ